MAEIICKQHLELCLKIIKVFFNFYFKMGIFLTVPHLGVIITYFKKTLSLLPR